MRARGKLDGNGVPRVAKLERVHLRQNGVRRGVALGASRARRRRLRRRRRRRGVGVLRRLGGGALLVLLRFFIIRNSFFRLRSQRRDVLAPHDIRRERVHDGGDLRVGDIYFLAERFDERGGFAGELLVHDAVALLLPRLDRALVSLFAALLHRRDALEAADDALTARAVIAQPPDLRRALPERRERARDGRIGAVAKGHRPKRARQRFGVRHLRLRQRVRQAPLGRDQNRVRLLRGVGRGLARPGQGAVRARRHRHAREKSVAARNRSGTRGTPKTTRLSVNVDAGPEPFDRSRRPRPRVS